MRSISKHLFAESLQTAASVFSITKAENYNFLTYPFTIRDSTSIPQILDVNFFSVNRITLWKKYPDEFFQAVIDYLIVIIQTTRNNIIMKISVLLIQCFVELQTTGKATISLQNRNSQHGQFDEILK